MKANKLLEAIFLIAASVFTLVSCKKDEPQLVHQPMEGLQAITFEKATGLMGSWSQKESLIYFYSDLFPILSLDGSTITIHSNPNNSLLFYYCQVDSTSSAALLPYGHVTSLDSLKNFASLPNCDIDKGAFFAISYKLPQSDCDFEFYLEVSNPSKGLYYRTASYRYVIFTPAGSNRFFHTLLLKP